MLNGLNIEGATPLHRMTVRLKLVILLVAGIVLYVIGTLPLLVPAFLVSGAVYVSTGLTWREGLRRLKPLLITILLLTAFTAFMVSPTAALEAFLRLMALVFLAGAVTATTPTGEFVDEITRLMTPLERTGLVRAADIGLAFGLVLRFVPDIFERYQAIRDAHRARGIRLRPLTILAPLIILTLKDADTIALAIDARGFRRRRTPSTSLND